MSEKENISKDETKLIDLMYISEKSSYSEPYFAFLINDFDEWFNIAINQLYVKYILLIKNLVHIIAKVICQFYLIN